MVISFKIGIKSGSNKDNPNYVWSPTKVGEADSCQLQFEDEIFTHAVTYKHLMSAHHVEHPKINKTQCLQRTQRLEWGIYI